MINILIGLGVPWAITTSSGLAITIPDTNELNFMVQLMALAVALYLVVLLAPSVHTWGRYGRAMLDRVQGWILFAIYFALAAAYFCWPIFRQALGNGD